MVLKKAYIEEQRCRLNAPPPIRSVFHQLTSYSYNPPEITTRDRIDWNSTDLIKCDVWALGLLCWEIMRGGAPFYEDQSIAALLEESGLAHSQSSLGSLTTLDSHRSTAEAVLNNLAMIQPHLKVIARQFATNRLRLDVPDFSRRMLTKHLEYTLESNPQLRSGDISSLPLVKYGVL